MATTRKVGLKANGKLKKGFRYNENGRIVKAKATTQKPNLHQSLLSFHNLLIPKLFTTFAFVELIKL